MQNLSIRTETPSWVVVDKPAGFHTHPPENAEIRINPRWNALAILERQLGQVVFPMHRLDRAASGLLLYSRKRALNSFLQQQFAAGSVRKTYFVVARGEIEGCRIFDEPLESESGEARPALTRAQACFSFTLPIPHPRGGMRRFTMLSVEIGTGRFHQIRRHFARAALPLIGDSRHGDRKLNREFAALTGCSNLFLRCMQLTFQDPESGRAVSTQARWSRDWHRLFESAGACPLTASPSRVPQRLS
ncbi:MAG: pseudouridine synthase [Bdellovibrionota bacterium]